MENNDRDLLLISIFTCLTVGLWVFFELVKTVKTTTVSQSVTQVITPFTPKLDTDILTILSQKKVY